MELILIIIILILLVIGFVVLYLRAGRDSVDLTPLINKLDMLQNFQERTDRSVRDEIAKFREEMKTASPAGKSGISRLTQVFRRFHASAHG